MNPRLPSPSNPLVSPRPLGLFLAVLALCTAATALAQEVAAGARAPELGIADLSGHPVTLASLRGRVVVVDFWASWCEPCATSMPVYQRLYSSLSGQGLTIVGVSQDTRAENARQFATRHRVTFPVLVDSAHAIANRYHPAHMPTAFVIDRRGLVRHVHQGWHASDAASLESQVRALLAEHP